MLAIIIVSYSTVISFMHAYMCIYLNCIFISWTAITRLIMS